MLAGSAGPAGGVNAVEITDAVQVVAPPRWSETVTTPSGPLIVLDVIKETCDPSDTLSVGVLIDNVPASSVKVAGVAAPAGITVVMATVVKAQARRRGFRMKGSFVRSWEQAGSQPYSL